MRKDEIPDRIAWLKDEEFEVVITKKHRLVFFVDQDKINADGQNPACDITDLWNETRGVPPNKFAEMMMDYADEHFCHSCKDFVDTGALVDVEQDFYPDLPTKICTDCSEAYDEDQADPYTLRGLHRSDFI